MSTVPFGGDGGEATENVEALTATPVHPYLELRVVCGSDSEYRTAFWHPEVALNALAPSAFPPSTNWLARLTGDQVLLVEESLGRSIAVAVGEGVVVEQVRVWLVDVRQPPSATLEGITHPFSGRSWPLTGPICWIGRRGKRLNHVELDHPTISRTHATLSLSEVKRWQLFREAGSSLTAVNGQSLEAGALTELKHGDLLNFGALQFRFHTREQGSGAGDLLVIRTLGSFEVRLGHSEDRAPQIRNEKSRWLLALLAVSWGQARSVETLMEQLWPELPATRGRKNLSYALSTLRSGLGLTEAEFEALVLRTPSTLQLNPERLGNHDLIEVQRLLSAPLLTSGAALERLLKLDTGPFLEGCYEEWAEGIRTRLSLDILEALATAGTAFLEHKEYALVERAARALQERDSLAETGILLLMHSHLEQGQAAEAVRVYEEFRQRLHTEGLEPSTELLRLFYQVSLGSSSG